MKRFGLFILKLFLIAAFVSLLLEKVYTHTYDTSNPRFKFQYLMGLKNSAVDYIFIGSSRVENGVNPKRIEEKTGKKVLNLGFQAGKINDFKMLLEMIKKLNISYQKIFIQIDYNYNLQGHYSNILKYEVIPFVTQYETLQSYEKRSDTVHQFGIRNIPFYRYMLNSPKLGIREVLAQHLSKKNVMVENQGFVALLGTRSSNEKYLLPDFILKNNQDFYSLNRYCIQNKISVVYYIAPFYKTAQNLDYIEKLKHKVPGIIDCSHVIQNSDYFQDSAHLNYLGAEKFTDFCIDKFRL